MIYRYRATFVRPDGSSYDVYEMSLGELGRHFIAKAEHVPTDELLTVIVLPVQKSLVKRGGAS